jgi:hypothetical protein
MLSFKYLVLSLVLGLIKSKPVKDRVTSLPNMNGGQPFSWEMYSGYLGVTDS